MIECNKIARPYAMAAFKYALCTNNLEYWSNTLYLLSNLYKYKKVQNILKTPNLYYVSKCKYLIDICGKESLDQYICNFINIIAKNKRLTLFPIIYKIYEKLKQEITKIIPVTVISAFNINSKYKKSLIKAISYRFNSKIHLNVHEDPSIIGGLIIIAEDCVIDGSVRGKLMQLSKSLYKN